jgi:hypothetical protein
MTCSGQQVGFKASVSTRGFMSLMWKMLKHASMSQQHCCWHLAPPMTLLGHGSTFQCLLCWQCTPPMSPYTTPPIPLPGGTVFGFSLPTSVVISTIQRRGRSGILKVQYRQDSPWSLSNKIYSKFMYSPALNNILTFEIPLCA